MLDRWSEDQRREDRRAALIAWTMASSFGWKKANEERFEIEDFMPRFVRQMTDEESREAEILRLEKVMMGMVNSGDRR